MVAICHHCGASKDGPLTPCSACGRSPKTRDETSLALLLTDAVLPPAKLAEAAELLKAGRPLSLSPGVRTPASVGPIKAQTSKPHASQRFAAGMLRLVGLLAGCVVLFIAVLQPWANRGGRIPDDDSLWIEAQRSGNVSALRSYLNTYPRGKHADAAKAAATTAADELWRKVPRPYVAKNVSLFLIEYPEATRLTIEAAVWNDAKTSDDIRRIRAYRKLFDKGTFSEEASGVASKLADTHWTQVASSRSETALKQFLQEFPETTHQSDVEARIQELYNEASEAARKLDDANWSRVALSRSETALKQFLKEFPKTTHQSDVEARIQELYNDLAWVQEQGTLDAYKRYLRQNPTSPNRAVVEKKMIDLEVAAIRAADHGELPPAQPLTANSGGSTTQIQVENGTAYELTVRYSGPDSQKVVVPAGENRSVNLTPGTYQVTASVSSANVRNYFGTDTLRGGTYSARYYIGTKIEERR